MGSPGVGDERGGLEITDQAVVGDRRIFIHREDLLPPSM
jgi:hypothetical protein